MTCKNYIFQDKGYLDRCILIPGWATNEQVFHEGFWSCFPLPFNRYYIDCITNDIRGKLTTMIKKEKKKVAILGFSMGGYIALDIAKACSEWVSDVFLWGVRPRYPIEDVTRLQKRLYKNKVGALKSFYKTCFATLEAYGRFENSLLNPYLELFSETYLSWGLTELQSCQLSLEGLNPDLNINVIHGDHDKVAPLKEVVTFWGQSQRAIQIITLEGEGHIPSLVD